jgi:cytochrome bd-type quinol oxidase subunit 2
MGFTPGPSISASIRRQREEEMRMKNSTRKLRTLLSCGVISGPLFYLVILIQMFTRSGFGIRRHPLSLLSLGNAGWIEISNFIVTGLLAIACAMGIRLFLRGGRAGTWEAFLIGTYGLGMITAGIFVPDPALGFPPGTPVEVPSALSGHAMLHGVGFFVAFLSLTAACFIFARRFFFLRRLGGASTPLQRG